MEVGDAFDGQGYVEERSTRMLYASPEQSENSKTSSDQLQLHFNTVESQPTNTASFTQQQQSVVSHGNIPNPNTVGNPYAADGYKYQQHSSSPVPGRMTQRSPGGYPPGSIGWINSSSANTNSSYMSPDRGRYNPRPPYPGYDPTKSYPSMAQHGRPTPWPQATYPQNYPGYNNNPVRYGQPDIAGPVVPAGVQALQANNNNVALMQHQHTPMLVPNPHYNQNLVQHPQINSENHTPNLDFRNDQHTPQRPGSNSDTMYSPAHSNSSSSGYYPTQSPQHQNMGAVHRQMSYNSPSVSPYPANPITPGSTKGKTRGNKCYQCPKCVKIFRRGDHLKRHLLSVHDHEHPYQCGECGKGFASVPALLKHAKSLHIGVLNKGLMCLRCQLTFPTIHEIEQHANSLHVHEDEVYMQSINTSSKQHMCGFCTKSFSSANALKRHTQQMHRNKEDTKLYCRDCGNGFAKLESLRKHVDKVHNGNPNAMPSTEDIEDTDTLSQAHSSESDSRGPSADTDESSLPAPAGNSQWGYTNPPPQQNETKPTGHGQVNQAPATMSPHPAANQQQPQSGPQPPGNSNQQPQQVAQPKLEPTTHQVDLTKSLENPDPPIPLQTNKMSMTQLNTGPAARVKTSSNVLKSTQSISPQVLPEVPTPVIEPKSVSESLLMAMKALSDIDYETPGFEMYPFPNGSSAGQHYQAAQSRNNAHQSFTDISTMKGSLSGPRNSPRQLEGNVLLNSGGSNDFLKRNGNFLVTMPPPPVMNMVCPSPLPSMAGAQEAPQLSQHLREDGGGVKIPLVINGQNRYPTMNNHIVESPKPKIARRKRKKFENINTESILKENNRPSHINDGAPNEEPQLFCTNCNISYESINDLMLHIESVHLKMNPNECCICKKHFAQAGNVKRHIRFVHLRERPFQCKNCSCTFDRLCYLQRHMRTHLQENDNNHEFNPLKPCNCPECGKRCLTAHHLRGHMQRKHFAKNKQKYTQFLKKYGHLEAIGAGPGALSNATKTHGRKRKELSFDSSNSPVSYDMPVMPDPLQISSMTPNSSFNMNPLSQEFPRTIHPDMNTQQRQQYAPSLPQSGINYHYNTQYEKVHTYGSTGAHAGNVTPQLMQPTSQQFINQSQNNILSDAIIPAYNYNTLNYNGNVNQNIPVQMEENFIAVNKKKTSRKIHRRTKKTQKRLRFKCQHCVLCSFANLQMLKSHMSLHHNKVLKQHVCLKCGDSYHKKAHLRSHFIQLHETDQATKQKKKDPNNRKSLLEKAQFSKNPTQFLPQDRPDTFCNSPLPSYYASPNPMYYDPNSPAMVPSPNVQMVYATPTHNVTTPRRLVQT